ncbi:hypothetical protein H4219_003465 [Mycoemilia scoparia]|uniref:MHD domain-containing protein n=1 Tax=Mycoemilia scoparia TaxID=417184 RepID=A0A9W7ZUW4_9FUNG|nr:hypothetical protein H4219_003465 [Mycoemilia scoparia]
MPRTNLDDISPSLNTTSADVALQYNSCISECLKLEAYINEKISILTAEADGLATAMERPAMSQLVTRSTSGDRLLPVYRWLHTEVSLTLEHYREHIARLKSMVKDPIKNFLAGNAWNIANQVNTRLQTMSKEIFEQNDILARLGEQKEPKSMFRKSNSPEILHKEIEYEMDAMVDRWQLEVPLILEQFQESVNAHREFIANLLSTLSNLNVEFIQGRLKIVQEFKDVIKQTSGAVAWTDNNQPTEIPRLEERTETNGASGSGRSKLNRLFKSRRISIFPSRKKSSGKLSRSESVHNSANNSDRELSNMGSQSSINTMSKSVLSSPKIRSNLSFSSGTPISRSQSPTIISRATSTGPHHSPQVASLHPTDPFNPRETKSHYHPEMAYSNPGKAAAQLPEVHSGVDSERNDYFSQSHNTQKAVAPHRHSETRHLPISKGFSIGQPSGAPRATSTDNTTINSMPTIAETSPQPAVNAEKSGTTNDNKMPVISQGVQDMTNEVKSNINKATSPFADNSVDNDSDDEDMSGKFKKFTIKDIAIQDNPEDAKMALNRMTSILRQNPQHKRRQRRTMYIGNADFDVTAGSKSIESVISSESNSLSPHSASRGLGRSQSVSVRSRAESKSPPPRPARPPVKPVVTIPEDTASSENQPDTSPTTTGTPLSPNPFSDRMTSSARKEQSKETAAAEQKKDNSNDVETVPLHITINEALSGTSTTSEDYWTFNSIVITGEVCVTCKSPIKEEKTSKLLLRFSHLPKLCGKVEYAINDTLIKLENEANVASTATTTDKDKGFKCYKFVNPKLFSFVKEGSPASFVVFKYRMVIDNAASAQLLRPFELESYWNLNNAETIMFISYSPFYQSMFCSSGKVSNIGIMVALDATDRVTGVASRPEGYWAGEKNRMLWALGDMDYTDRSVVGDPNNPVEPKSVISRFNVSNGPRKHGILAIKFEVENFAAGGFDVSIIDVTNDIEKPTVIKPIEPTSRHLRAERLISRFEHFHSTGRYNFAPTISPDYHFTGVFSTQSKVDLQNQSAPTKAVVESEKESVFLKDAKPVPNESESDQKVPKANNVESKDEPLKSEDTVESNPKAGPVNPKPKGDDETDVTEIPKSPKENVNPATSPQPLSQTDDMESESKESLKCNER